ncbi:glycosyltransferase family 2 protein [Litorivicinus lipolyticus]|uniref:glycosyltransferase family 2 protein n=1 Tax=Litorivicinus lipolyticus TaxID=418701 RepID=UPI003B5C1323
MTEPTRAPISAILITKNEAGNIRRCLSSVAFCQQIVVVDSGSTDETADIARRLGADVSITSDWPGFGPQKNRALAVANQPWVFSIDADEWVSDELAASIRKHIEGARTGARVRRASSFCGQVMRHSGWGDDWVVRLFPRKNGRFSEDLVHERLVVTGTPVDLAGPLNHESHRDLAHALKKNTQYAELWASQSNAAGRRSGIGRAILKGAFATFRTYVLRQGFRDGSLGLLLAIVNGHGTFYKYAMLWLKSAGRQR